MPRFFDLCRKSTLYAAKTLNVAILLNNVKFFDVWKKPKVFGLSCICSISFRLDLLDFLKIYLVSLIISVIIISFCTIVALFYLHTTVFLLS